MKQEITLFAFLKYTILIFEILLIFFNISENANIASQKDLTGKNSVSPVTNLFGPVKFDKIYNAHQWVVAFLWDFGPVNGYSYSRSLQKLAFISLRIRKPVIWLVLCTFCQFVESCHIGCHSL